MAMRITFDLAESDLKHFRTIMREARTAAKEFQPEEILLAAEALLVEVRNTEVPEFIANRLERLQIMIDMIRDDEWKLPATEMNRVLNALAYFTEPEDLIPDHIPGLGFLDDAIMVELVVRELRHEIEAYEDFCNYRNREENRRKSSGVVDDVTREEWLRKRRRELHERMVRRRSRDRGSRRGRRKKTKSPFSLF